jgi:hypothetical protein
MLSLKAVSTGAAIFSFTLHSFFV